MSKATLRFLGYELEQIIFKRNLNYNNSEESNILPKINANIIYKNEKKTEANIIIGIKYNIEENLPFTLELIIRGFFVFKEKDQKIVFQNGTAIMYPYIRSIITDITSKTNYTPLILPTMNFYEVLYKNIEDYTLVSEKYLDFDEI